MTFCVPVESNALYIVNIFSSKHVLSTLKLLLGKVWMSLHYMWSVVNEANVWPEHSQSELLSALHIAINILTDCMLDQT